MAKISTYATLVSACKDLGEDDSVEYGNYIPTAIGLAEARINKEVDTLGHVLNATATVASGNNLVTKPSDWRSSFDTYIETSAGIVNLAHKQRSYVRDYWPVSASTGQPKYYADKNNTQIIVAPTPASSYTCYFDYNGPPAALTSASPTNYWTDYHPDVIFHATMVEMARFSRNGDLLAKEEAAYQASRDGMINEGRRQRRDDGSTPTNPEGGPNTLKEGDR